jgi:ubiquinone biosynthesis protein UbiJ
LSSRPFALAGMQRVVNRLVGLDPELAEGLAELEGAVLEVYVQGFDWRFQLHASQAGVQVVPVDDGEGAIVVDADVRISGPPFTLLRLLGSMDTVAGVLPPEVSISGDLRLVEKLGRLAKRIDIDWEEPLAKLFGDSATHEIGRGMRAALSWVRTASETFALDMGEYLREERRLSPTKLEVEDFSALVDVLRDDVERLEVRIARLAGSIREP